jgi:hypothetical protein
VLKNISKKPKGKFGKKKSLSPLKNPGPPPPPI